MPEKITKHRTTQQFMRAHLRDLLVQRNLLLYPGGTNNQSFRSFEKYINSKGFKTKRARDVAGRHFRADEAFSRVLYTPTLNAHDAEEALLRICDGLCPINVHTKSGLRRDVGYVYLLLP